MDFIQISNQNSQSLRANPGNVLGKSTRYCPAGLSGPVLFLQIISNRFPNRFSYLFQSKRFLPIVSTLLKGAIEVGSMLDQQGWSFDSTLSDRQTILLNQKTQQKRFS